MRTYSERNWKRFEVCKWFFSPSYKFSNHLFTHKLPYSTMLLSSLPLIQTLIIIKNISLRKNLSRKRPHGHCRVHQLYSHEYTIGPLPAGDPQPPPVWTRKTFTSNTYRIIIIMHGQTMIRNGYASRPHIILQWPLQGDWRVNISLLGIFLTGFEYTNFLRYILTKTFHYISAHYLSNSGNITQYLTWDKNSSGTLAIFKKVATILVY